MKILSIILLLAQVAVIAGFWTWNHVHHPMGNQLTGGLTGKMLAYGRLAGLIAAFGALFQILLLSRVRWIERAFGLDRLSRLHHVVGFVLVIAILSHPLLVLIGHASQADQSLLAQYKDFMKSWEDVQAASIATALMIVALVFSVIVIFKKIRYEAWYATHLLFYVAIAMAFGHQLAVGTDFTREPYWFRYYWIALNVFVLLNLVGYRLARPLWLYRRHRFGVAGVNPETADVNSVYIEGRNMEKFRIEAGQFMIFRFLGRGFRWEAHPFSLSCMPGGNRIRISVKALGDFTRKIPQLQPGTKVLIDGPHGVFTSRKCRNQKVLFVAGGIGITPIRSLIEEMAGQGKDMFLIYGNRNRAGIVFEKELDVIRAQGAKLTVYHVLSDDATWPGEKGKIDRDRIARLVPDVKDRDIYLCGPPPMMKLVRKSLIDLGVRPSRVHWERFAL